MHTKLRKRRTRTRTRPFFSVARMPKTKKSGGKPKIISKTMKTAVAPTASFGSYVGKLQKKMYKDDKMNISKGAVSNLNEMALFLIDRLAVEGTRASKYAKSSTLNYKAAKAASKLVIFGVLHDKTDTFASKVLTRVAETEPSKKKAKASENGDVAEGEVE
jgi:hypothetical protein